MPNLLSNSYEDFIDDLSTNLIYKESKSLFEPLKDKFRSDTPSVYDDAMQSAITTLQFGINRVVLQHVNEYMYAKLLKVGSALFVYIISGSIVRGVKSKFKRALSRAKSKGLRGRALKGFMGLVSSDTDKSNRIEESKIALSMLGEYEKDKNVKLTTRRKDKEYLNKLVIDGSKSNNESSLVAYAHKTKTSTWKNTPEDKALYKRATKQSLKGVSFTKIIKELNKYGEYAKDTENNLLNMAQVQLDTLTAHNIERVK